MEKRLHVVSYRLTDSEAARIDAAAAAMKPARTRQDWCRAAALHVAKVKVPAPPPPRRHPARRLPKADVQALGRVLGALGKLGGHTNQLARAANIGSHLPETAELVRIRELLERMRDEVRAALGAGG